MFQTKVASEVGMDTSEESEAVGEMVRPILWGESVELLSVP